LNHYYHYILWWDIQNYIIFYICIEVPMLHIDQLCVPNATRIGAVPGITRTVVFDNFVIQPVLPFHYL
jgi:hypothetical protein